jgi:hypothetical protein
MTEIEERSPGFKGPKSMYFLLSGNWSVKGSCISFEQGYLGTTGTWYASQYMYSLSYIGKKPCTSCLLTVDTTS